MIKINFENSGLSRRTINILYSLDIYHFQQLTNFKIKELLEIRGLGRKRITELVSFLERHNLKFKDYDNSRQFRRQGTPSYLEGFTKEINSLFVKYSMYHSFSELIDLTKKYTKRLKDTEKQVKREIATQNNIESLKNRKQKKICVECDQVFSYKINSARFCCLSCGRKNWMRRKRLATQIKTD